MAKKATRSRADREQFWRELIERQQQSGRSIRAFCESEGVSQPSFYSWRKRLQESNGRPTAQFVPVQIAVESAPARQGRIEILLSNGKCVRVEPGFDAQVLRDVLAVLEQQPC